MIRVGVLTASDKGSRGERADTSGPAIRELMAGIQGEVQYYVVVPDDRETIADELRKMADELQLDLALTTGGTGLSPRDNTPEATLAVVEKLVPGLAEVMRSEGLKKTPHAMLSRAMAGVRGKTLIVNLPGSERAVRENLSVILPALPHAVEVLRGEAHDCAELRKD